MLVEQLMSRPVLCCRPDDTLATAAQLMWEHDCGFLPVVTDTGAPQATGVITDRDICMCALFQGKRLCEINVSEAMAKHAHVCHASDKLADAEQLMREARVRRLPVIDEKDRLVGVISLADLAQEARITTNELDIARSEVGDTLAAICAPAHKQLAA